MLMRKILFTLLALLPLSVVAASTDAYLFRMLDTNDGLPDNNVRNMVMLPDGLMAIQTSSMLNLYDGASCQSYRYDPNIIPFNEYSGLSNLYYDVDEQLLWCTSRDHVWTFDLRRRTFQYDVNEHLRHFALSADVVGFYLDAKGDYWVTTDDHALWRCNRQKGVAERIDLLSGMEAPLAFAQHDDSLWMLSRNGLLACYDVAIGTFRQMVPYEGSMSAEGVSRMDMTITSGGNLWVMFDRELLYYEVTKNRMLPVEGMQLQKGDLFTTIALDAQDNLWVGSARSGVRIVDAKTLESHQLPYLQQTNGKRIYHHTDISKIYVDKRNGVWVATLSEGLLYYHKDIVHLRTIHQKTLRGGQMPDESVKCMVEDADGTILVGTIHGLLRYDPKQATMSVPWPALSEELCISLYRDSHDRIWLGTFYNGAFCIDRGKIRHYVWPERSTVENSYHDATPNYNCVRAIYEDTKGDFWISVYGGVGRFDTERGEITLLAKEHPDLGRFMTIRDIYEAEQGFLLFAGDRGTFGYEPERGEVLMNTQHVGSMMLSNQIVEDSHRRLWVATSEGLAVVNPAIGTRTMVGAADGFPTGHVMSLAIDPLGDVWAATFSHLLRIKPLETERGLDFSVAVYGPADGVEAGAFFQRSVLLHSNGNIYFGGAHGISEVIPTRMYSDHHDVQPRISSLYISGTRIDVGKEFNGRVLLPVELSQAEPIDLRHDESFLTFEFSNLNYANPSHTTYRYKLENFDKEWREIHSHRLGRATYTYLEPGDYTFRVVAADNDIDWSEHAAEFHFTVHPPFYRTTVALIFYAVSLLSVVVVGLFYLSRRAQRRFKYRQLLEKQRQREHLDQMKLRFYTNISHELRTPLSLILLPLEGLRRELADSPHAAKLDTMHHNATQLLSLVNHLLDFRKLEMGGERLLLVQGNWAEFVENQLIPFRDATQNAGIRLIFENDMEHPVMVFDKAKMARIVNNILSNAIKFTAANGMISVRVSQRVVDGVGMALLEITDTGMGIPARDLPHIFDRFYQSEKGAGGTGSGIGLNLVKQYVEMMGGEVTVESKEGEGTLFVVRVPMNLSTSSTPESMLAQGEAEAEPEPVQPAPSAEDMRPTVMVVDDNDDFRQYLAQELSRNYRVVVAANGEECLAKIATAEPGVLVCDVMMPEMDGFEVTRRLRSNIETSHIPIILLSARTSDDVRLEGYETGADAYITKPFKMDLLEARIRNLIDERQRRISNFSQSADATPTQLIVTTIDQKLMQRIMESIERNMDNSEYSVESLSADAGMHRMNLYRKLQSLVGMPPSEFIRTMRLKRAAQLLREDPKLTVGEVSDRVGFNTPKYFTRYFRELFGCTPSQYRSRFDGEEIPKEAE